ncbi:TPT protein [Rhizoctonia solani]|uniref:TPT protein n=1 Tax=Rhizoctonia solani TaxID=456999 RepID=A0A8H7M8B6_9AGAM|nr:TPT protein [Rhizoctonia solani]
MAGTLTGGRLRSGSVHTHTQSRPHPGWMMDKARTENGSGYLPSPANMNPHRSFLASASSTLSSLSVPKPDLHAAPSLTQATPSVSTLRFVGLCSLWYLTSALSSNTGKSIMIQFRYPVTLTFVQFAFFIAHPYARYHSEHTPMAAFQVGGHIFSSMAISRVPVSTVHTIKALSPLFTVAAYRLLFGVSYSFRTYVSLLPLTIGVMLACTFDVAGSNLFGLMCAFGSALVFVSSNIFFKKIMPSNGAATATNSTSSIYSSIRPGWPSYSWFPSGCTTTLATCGSVGTTTRLSPVHQARPAHSVMYYFFLNGTVHWAQNIIAFAILATTSPVTYSIASLIKRSKGLGIVLTFVGLWMYNQAKGDVERGEHKARRVEAGRQLQLPTSKSELITPQGSPHPQHSQIYEHGSAVQVHAYAPPPAPDQFSYWVLSLSPASLDSPPQSAGIRLKNRRGTHDEHNLGLELHQIPTPQPHSQF